MLLPDKGLNQERNNHPDEVDSKAVVPTAWLTKQQLLIWINHVSKHNGIYCLYNISTRGRENLRELSRRAKLCREEEERASYRARWQSISTIVEKTGSLKPN